MTDVKDDYYRLSISLDAFRRWTANPANDWREADGTTVDNGDGTFTITVNKPYAPPTVDEFMDYLRRRCGGRGTVTLEGYTIVMRLPEDALEWNGEAWVVRQ